MDPPCRPVRSVRHRNWPRAQAVGLFHICVTAIRTFLHRKRACCLWACGLKASVYDVSYGRRLVNGCLDGPEGRRLITGLERTAAGEVGTRLLLLRQFVCSGNSLLGRSLRQDCWVGCVFRCAPVDLGEHGGRCHRRPWADCRGTATASNRSAGDRDGGSSGDQTPAAHPGRQAGAKSATTTGPRSQPSAMSTPCGSRQYRRSRSSILRPCSE
jgi:hypothetical protein